MWEKMKKSKFAAKLKAAKTSRAVYITVITLLLALAVLITATAIANRAKKRTETPPDENPSQEGNNPSQNNPPSGDQGNTEKPSTGDDTGNTPGKSDDKKDTTTSAIPELSLPVTGVIAKGYDSSIQVYSATTGDYRIHLGVDMTTKEDCPVFAAADGVVSKIWNDAMMGQCLAISHSGDCYTIYKNLAATLPDGIAEGTSVSAGQQIGTVGESATLELAEEPHLHLEMTVKGLSVDPLEYFSAQALAAIGTDKSYETPAMENK